MPPQTPRRTAVWPVYAALALLAAFTIVFVTEFANLSSGWDAPNSEDSLTADTYMLEVSALLADADPENGPALLTQHGCMACHRDAADNHLAPSYVGLAERAPDRHPPLTAAAYIYESIRYPRAHEVEGYSAQMPQLALSDSDLGDIIAYLLTQDGN